MPEMPWYVKPSLTLSIYVLVAAAMGVSLYLKADAITNIIVGAIIAEFARASGFWFGSSDGSAKKDVTIAEQSKALAVSTPAPTVTTTTTEAPAGTTTTTTEPAKV